MMTERLLASSRPKSLTVVFDGDCLLCRRSVHWLQKRRQTVAIRSIPAASVEATTHFGDIANYGDDMIVAADDGRVWIGPPDAYLVIMWALPLLRPLSYLLSIAPLKPLVGRIFQLVTGNRQVIGSWIGGEPVCEHCVPATG